MVACSMVSARHAFEHMQREGLHMQQRPRLGLAQALLGGLGQRRGGGRGRQPRRHVIVLVIILAQQREGRVRAHQRRRLALALLVRGPRAC
jgi:hypothetical protein